MQRAKSIDGTAFHLILLDLQMPISDGYDALKSINLLYDEFKVFKIDNCYSNFSQQASLSDQIDDVFSQRHIYLSNGKEKKPYIIACSGHVDSAVVEMT